MVLTHHRAVHVRSALSSFHAGNMQDHDTPTCSQSATPEPVDLDNYNWSELNTPLSTVRRDNRKPERTIQLRCTSKLRILDAAEGKPDGLNHLLNGTRTIIAQKWKTLLLYFDRDKDFPECARLWSHVEWRKWDVVEFLTAICCTYYLEVVKAEKENVDLCTKQLDQEFLALVEHILEAGKVGAEGERVIAVKEWERPGTKRTMETRTLIAEDVGGEVGEEEEDDEEDVGGDGDREEFEEASLVRAEMDVDEEMPEPDPVERPTTDSDASLAFRRPREA